jgi:hypothetical protein
MKAYIIDCMGIRLNKSEYLKWEHPSSRGDNIETVKKNYSRIERAGLL